MVLSERITGDVVRNGRRSRGPSPNTHTSGAAGIGAANAHNASSGIGVGSGGNTGTGGGNNSTNSAANEKSTTTAPGAGTPESSDDDNSTKRNGKTKAKQSEYEEKIRVGRDYQAVCPQLVPEPDRRPELMNERALLVWSPTKEIPDMKLEEYISVAKEKYGYNGEQALGMLFWHKHDLERAVMDLANFTPFPDEWTIEDKVLFEQAFQFHGKSFHRIRQMLPDKSIASLVKYYYSWKKTRHRSSAMDRQEKMIKAAVKDGSENGSELGSNEESDNDDKRANNNNSAMSNNNNNNNNNNNHNSSSSSSSQNAGNGSNGNNSNNNNNSSSSSSNNNNNNNNNSSSSSSNNNNGNSNNSNATGGDNNHGGSGGAGSAVSGVNSNSGSSSNNNNNNNSNSGGNNSNIDLDEPLCIYTNSDDMLGFNLPGFSLPTDNGPDNIDIDNSAGSVSGNTSTRRVVGGFCKNCNVVCYILFDSPLGRMCKSCHTHWRRTGNRRPISGPDSIASTKRSTHNSASAAAADRSKRKPPRGMYINHDDLTALAGCKNPCEYLAEGDRKIAALMAEIQKNRQMMEQLEKDCGDINTDEGGGTGAGKTLGNSEAAAAATQPRITARWSADEIEVALLALRGHGKNFPMIAKVVGNKTEAHVRTFYVSNRRRLELDRIVKEHEAMASTKAEESNAKEQGVEAAAAAAAASAASAKSAANSTAAGAAANATDGSKTVASDVSGQETLAKKDESSNANINASKKKNPELNSAAVSALKSSETANPGAAAGAPPLAAISAASGNSNAASLTAALANKSLAISSGTTITIVDESDTATSSSSDVVTNSNNAAQTVGNSASSLSSGISSSSSSSNTPAKSSTNNNHNVMDTDESTSLKSAPVPVKRDSDLNTADLPPAKRVALNVNAEFLAK